MIHPPAPITILIASLAVPLALGGCAGRGDLAELRAEVAALARAVEARDADTAAALSAARLAREEVAAARDTADAAARDAAESRRLLERMDARMGDTLGERTLK